MVELNAIAVRVSPPTALPVRRFVAPDPIPSSPVDSFSALSRPPEAPPVPVVAPVPKPAAPAPLPSPPTRLDSDAFERFQNDALSQLISREAAPVAAAPPSTAFSTLYHQDFSDLSTRLGGKTELTAPDIDHLMQDPGIVGPEAADVAVLRGYSDALTAQGMQTTFLSGKFELTPKLGPAQSYALEYSGLQAGLAQYQDKLKDASNQPFAAGGPDYTALKQGGAGDCFLISTLAGLAKNHPEQLQKMVDQNADGTYTVNFPGAGPVTVSAPTQAEIAAYSTSGQNGTWGTLFEKAYGELAAKQGYLSPAAADKSGIEPIEGIAGGGLVPLAIGALTGHTSAQVAFPPSDQKAKDVPDILSSGQKLGRVMVAVSANGSGSDQAHLPDGLPCMHSMTVLGFDPATNEVTIRNPWGNNGADGSFAPTDGSAQPGNTGVFTIPLQSFYKSFQRLYIETDKPVG